jgi:hypothetical protein
MKRWITVSVRSRENVTHQDAVVSGQAVCMYILDYSTGSVRPLDEMYLPTFACSEIGQCMQCSKFVLLDLTECWMLSIGGYAIGWFPVI